MKHGLRILTAILLCALVILPMTAYAKTFPVSDTDLTVDIDDSMWYVFTWDNIENNPELEELGLTYEQAKKILEETEACLDAVLFYDDGNYLELFVRKTPTDSGLANLSNYDDKDVLDFAKSMAKKIDTDDYSVYKNEYKFAKVEYFDEEFSCYICAFATCVNKDIYTFTFQSTVEFTDYDYEVLTDIVDSVKFDVDTSLKENLKKKGTNWIRVVVCGIVGGIGGLIASLASRKKKPQIGQIGPAVQPEEQPVEPAPQPEENRQE